MLAVSMALWVLAQSPAKYPSVLTPGELIFVGADHVQYNTDQHTLRATGHARLRTKRASLKADVVDYDQQTAVAHASGHVVMVTDLTAAVADEVTLNLDTLDTQIEKGLVFQKKGVLPDALRSADSAEAVEKLGVTTLAMRGTHFERRSEQEYRVSKLDFTPCDCDPLKPHWKIKSSQAIIIPGDHAWLKWPVIQVYGVPVFALPVLYVPLLDRKTGLLIPTVSYSTFSGWNAAAPVFLTLGESYDLTLTPGYWFGVPPSATHQTADQQLTNGIRGPEFQAEFRYAAARTTRGDLTLDVFDDFRAQRSPNTLLGTRSAPRTGEPAGSLLGTPRSEIMTPGRQTASFIEGSQRGLRGQLAWQHSQELGNGWHDRVDLSLLSDTWLGYDGINTDLLSRVSEYSRSTASLARTTENAWVGLDIVLRQDLRYGYSLFDADPPWLNAPRYGPNPLARLPAFTWGLPEQHVLGPLLASLQIETSRLSPLKRRSEDDGVGGLYYLDPAFNVNSPGAMRIGIGDGRWEPGERQSRDRIDLRPGLAANFAVGSLLRIRPYVSYREDLYLNEVSQNASSRGYFLGGIRIESELSRTFGAGSGLLRHSITPSFEARYVPYVFGGPLMFDDEVDNALRYDPAARHKGIGQGVVMIRQRLSHPVANLMLDYARLDLGQELDAQAPGLLGDVFLRGRVTVPFLDLQGEVRADERSRAVTQASASATLSDARTDQLLLAFDRLAEGGSRRARQGIDELVGSNYGFVDPLCGTSFALSGHDDSQCPSPNALSFVPATRPIRFSNHIGIGITARIAWGLALSYRTDIVPDTSHRPLDPKVIPLALQQHTGFVIFKPACDCWEVDVGGIYAQPYESPYYSRAGGFSFKFNFTIAHFGSFGS